MASSEPTARLAQEMLCQTVSGWGMTEVGVGASLSFLDSSEDDRCMGSGFPLPGYEFKVIDPETGADLPADSPGEMCVRTYAIMLGYYKKPEETSRAVDAEGWFHTGDLATIRADGQVRFIGRIKEMLKVGGENVDPVEVEALMLGHPAVSEVQIVGVPDERLSEVACACVILEEGQGGHGRGTCRILPGQSGQFQDAPPRCIHAGIPDDAQREGPEVQAQGAGGGSPGP